MLSPQSSRLACDNQALQDLLAALARAAQRMARMDSDDDDDDGFWCERMWIYLTYFDILDDQIWIDTVDGAMSPWFGLGLQLHDAAWPWPVRHSRLCFVCSHSVRNLTGRPYHDIIMHVKCWETRTQWEMILATIWDICTNSLNVFPALVVFFMFFPLNAVFSLLSKTLKCVGRLPAFLFLQFGIHLTNCGYSMAGFFLSPFFDTTP